MSSRLDRALDAFRVVVLHGARQTGKTTLARQVAQERGGTYLTLDNRDVRQAAEDDPRALLLAGPFPVVVDEVQLAGDRVVRELKMIVDENPEPGRYLVTGSTNFLTVPTISESLAGRAVLLRLTPLSEAELAGVPPDKIDSWFEGRLDRPARDAPTRADYMELVCRGGYPEILSIPADQRQDWFESYAETVTQRDLAALADIRKTGALPRLLRLMASSTARELNISEVSRRLGLHRITVQSYVDWLQSVFLAEPLPAWSRNLANREIKRPKLHLSDTGLAAALLGLSPDSLAQPTSTAAGPLLESFVVNEILRQLSSRTKAPSVMHWRENSRHEADIVLERPTGDVVAVEVKATSSPQRSHARSLARLRDLLDSAAPGAFKTGVLLHTGHRTLKLDDRIFSTPISTLWSG